MNQMVPVRSATPTLAYSGPQLELIKRTVAADCNDNEFNLFIEVAKRVALDPFRRQIYAVVYNKDKPDKRRMSIITGIDGYRAVSARTGRYRPDEQAPVFTYNDALKNPDLNPLGLEKCTARIFILGADEQWYPVSNEAYWEEYAPLTEAWEGPSGQRKPTGKFELDKRSKWFTMGRVMLAKCAEAGCHRKAYPEDLSGVYIAEEMDQARVADMTATDQLEEHARDQRMLLTRANDTVCIVWDPGKPMEAVPIDQFADEVEKRLPLFTSVADLVGWRETNKVGLNHFWAKNKSDALQLKKMIEAREAELRSGSAQ
jgi:phage recombination protein Bet